MLLFALMVVLCGQVVGPDGNPASGVEVELVDAHGARLVATRTGDDGRFCMRWEAKAGVYAVRASRFGCVTASLPFRVQQVSRNFLLRLKASDRRRLVPLQNGNKVDLGRLPLKSYTHAITVTGIGLFGVFFILAILIGVVRGANALIRRLS